MTEPIQEFDVAIIGAGINGCGCAADAALRGLRVFLCDKSNIAAATSSNSSKLIHGGLRYLEHYDFNMVKKALDEQQRLLDLVPHLVHPQPFVLPLMSNERPAWLVHIGLFIYDHLSFTNHLPNSHKIDRTTSPALFEPLKSELTKGFEFYDCATDDTRLTIMNALQAQIHGAQVHPYTSLIRAELDERQWLLTFLKPSNQMLQIKAKTVINAGGPWVETIAALLHTPIQQHITLVKGSHIVTQRLYSGEQAYLLQHHDKRVVFVVPFHGYSMIGTTDVPFSDHPERAEITPEEVDYLLTLTNQYFQSMRTPEDIVYSWSGVRPLLAASEQDPAALSRDYSLEVCDFPAPTVTIFGGKITTYRQLSEQVIDHLGRFLPDLMGSKTSTTPLPGASWDQMDFTTYQNYARQQYLWLAPTMLQRYLNTYGTRTELILQNCTSIADLGPCFMPTLYAREIDYLCRAEWATTVEDILWRHTKLGFTTSEAEKDRLNAYLTSKRV